MAKEMEVAAASIKDGGRQISVEGHAIEIQGLFITESKSSVVRPNISSSLAGCANVANLTSTTAHLC